MPPSTFLEELEARFGKRYQDAIQYVDYCDVFATRDNGLEVTGTINTGENEYGYHIEFGNQVCGCMDFFVRKKICKHLIAGVLKAVHLRLIDVDDALGLLQDVKKEDEHEI